MKRCTKCKEYKEESDFYKSQVNKSGLHAWCKACLKKNSQRQGSHQSWKTPTAASTEVVRQLLLDNGIPSCPGTAMNRNKVDLMAWACVPIEAKIARQSKPNQFIWTFTRGQLGKLDGLIICIADYGDRKRVLVIPIDRIRYSVNEKTVRQGSLAVTIESFDPRSQWPALMEYEDRYDLIEIERLKFRTQIG